MYTRRGAGKEWLLVQSDPHTETALEVEVVSLEVKLSTQLLQVASS